VDGSASQCFGSQLQQKREIAAEIAAVLAFSAVSNNDKVGLLTFTDRIERLVPPGKGTRHALRLVRDILFFQPQQTGTAIGPALDYLNRILHRRTIVFLLSDFLDYDFERSFKQTARRHDLIAIRIADHLEEYLPAVGLLEVEDPESGERRLVDTSSIRFRRTFVNAVGNRREALRALCRSAQADLIEVGTEGNHLDALVRFFVLRARRLRNT
jgi:uncharacterized protein (DUF58 family)